jgi:hypothetical protein
MTLPTGMVNNVLADRGDGGTCNMPRLPTGRFPPYAKTIAVTLDANGNGTAILEAERDLLLIDLSIVVPDETPTSSTVSLTYCNVRMLDQSSKRNWAFCCASKPPFCLGVRENKKAEFQINGGTPAGVAYVTVSGFQGNGCCG